MSLAISSTAVAPARAASPTASERAARTRRRHLIRRRSSHGSPVLTRAAAGPAANADGMYDGTVFFHLYPELNVGMQCRQRFGIRSSPEILHHLMRFHPKNPRNAKYQY